MPDQVRHDEFGLFTISSKLADLWKRGDIHMLPFEEAVAKFKEILKHDPENAQIWCSWGVALMEMKQFDEAVEKFEKAAGFSPDFASAWYGWGVALSALGQKEAATEKIKKAMELDPDSSQDPSAPE